MMLMGMEFHAPASMVEEPNAEFESIIKVGIGRVSVFHQQMELGFRAVVDPSAERESVIKVGIVRVSVFHRQIGVSALLWACKQLKLLMSLRSSASSCCVLLPIIQLAMAHN